MWEHSTRDWGNFPMLTGTTMVVKIKENVHCTVVSMKTAMHKKVSETSAIWRRISRRIMFNCNGRTKHQVKTIWAWYSKNDSRGVSLYVFQRETRCTGPRLGSRTAVRFWTTYVYHAESELSAWFETRCISVHFARFRGVSSPYLRSVYHTRYETMETPWKGTETAACVSWFCRPVVRPILVNEQCRANKSSRPTNNVAWTTHAVHGRNTYSETSLVLRVFPYKPVQKSDHDWWL